jgi:hypothetical protein
LRPLDVPRTYDIVIIEIMPMQTVKSKDIIPSKILQAILDELRLLRNEMTLLLPQEDLEDYAHEDRIRTSYQKAIKKYPPTWR